MSNFNRFAVNILARYFAAATICSQPRPANGDIAAATRSIAEQEAVLRVLRISAREVKDEYGSAAAACLKLMFKRRQRGGFSDRTQQGYKTMWVANPGAAATYLNWFDTTPEAERTCQSLHKALLASNLMEEVWVKRATGSGYESKAMLDLIERRASNLHRRLALNKLTPDEIEEHTARYF